MKPYYLTSKLFPFLNDVDQKSLPRPQLRQLGLLYSCYRIVVSFFLLISSHSLLMNKVSIGLNLPSFFHQIMLWIYCAFSLLLLAFFVISRAGYSNQLALGLILDVLSISILLYLNSQADMQFFIMYMVVVAVSFMLLVSYQAVLITMLAVIFVIYQQFFNAVNKLASADQITESILICISFICIGYISWSLSQRLVKIERIANNSKKYANKLNAITQEVVRTMQQGILVVDVDTNILISNYATNLLLKLDLDDQYDIYSDNHHNQDINRIEKTNHLVKEATLEKHPELIEWIHNACLDHKSQMVYSLPKCHDKLRISITPMHDGTILVFIEDLQREQTNAQQLKLVSLGQLTASIAHEIRNPLAAISQASELLLEDEMIEKELRTIDTSVEVDPNAELYSIIFDQTKRVNRIIEDVLKLSRQAKPDQVRLDLVSWLNIFIANFYQDHDIFLRSKSHPDVYFDPHHLEQVLINLINNGLRFASKVHPHVFVEIEVSLQENDVILDILDEGDGVPVDKQENLFMPFFTTDHEGTGLGLYLSQAFSEANFARLQYVDSHQKTCFRLIIPQAMSNNNVQGTVT